MSLVKRFADDVEEIREGATVAAWCPDDPTRIQELTYVFADCGTWASVYADPATVVKVFVREAVKAFQDERARIKREEKAA